MTWIKRIAMTTTALLSVGGALTVRSLPADAYNGGYSQSGQNFHYPRPHVPAPRHVTKPRKAAPVRHVVRRPAAPRTRAAVGRYYLGSFPITGYSWGCGAYGAPMHSGLMPFVGAIASDVIPQGTRLLVVADTYTYIGTVLDTGQGHGGLDLFSVSCAQAYSYTRSSARVYVLR